jgi:DNA invertase Pin-like site-specific DNA recombinase
MFGMLSVLAELPRELIVAKTRDGLAAARGGQLRSAGTSRRSRTSSEVLETAFRRPAICGALYS